MSSWSLDHGAQALMAEHLFAKPGVGTGRIWRRKAKTFQVKRCVDQAVLPDGTSNLRIMNITANRLSNQGQPLDCSLDNNRQYNLNNIK
jgi:hypothetical protein